MRYDTKTVQHLPDMTARLNMAHYCKTAQNVYLGLNAHMSTSAQSLIVQIMDYCNRSSWIIFLY